MNPIRLFISDPGPRRLSRYELLGEIATGGMATVYLARLKGPGGFRRLVAIKCLLRHLAKQRDFVEMFLDEARLSAAIRHPNVVPIFEIDESRGYHFIVMEYIEGDSLAGLQDRCDMSNAPMPAPITLRIGIDMLAGLHAAHELVDDRGEPMNLIHRDVSPQNILVGVDGNVRLTDFGVARAASRLSSTREGHLKGKLAYMAPEYVLNNGNLDRRADIFSAGIVIWEGLAHKRLFKSENDAGTLARILEAAAPPLARVAPHISGEVSSVVMRALRRDPAERFATCSEFAAALEAAARGVMSPASPRELASYLDQFIGERVRQQREEIRSHVTRLDQASTEAVGDEARSTAADPLFSLDEPVSSPPTPLGASPDGTPLVTVSRGASAPVPKAPAGARLRPLSLTLALVGSLGAAAGTGAYFGAQTGPQSNPSPKVPGKGSIAAPTLARSVTLAAAKATASTSRFRSSFETSQRRSPEPAPVIEPTGSQSSPAKGDPDARRQPSATRRARTTEKTRPAATRRPAANPDAPPKNPYR